VTHHALDASGRRHPIALLAALVAFLVLAGGGVAVASWTASTTTSGSVAAATTSATVTNTTQLNTIYQFTGAASASPVIIAPIVVTNTGSAPLVYSLSVGNVAGSVLAPAISLSVWLMTAANCGSTIPVGTPSGTLAAPPALPAGTTSAAPLAGFTLCVATRLTTTVDASQGLAVAPTIVITGRVGTSAWTTTASGSFSQYTAISMKCANQPYLAGLLGQPVLLSWTVPPGAGTYQYRIVTAANQLVMPAQSATSVTIAYSNVASLTSPGTFYLQSSTDGFLTGYPSLPIVLTFQAGVLGVLLASVSCP
jgi:hypothetical protein